MIIRHQIRVYGYFVVLMLLLSGCVSNQYVKSNKLFNKRFEFEYEQKGIASWYGYRAKFCDKRTASGDKYNKDFLTAAHKNLPFRSVIRVTNIKNNKSLIIVINDRGPFYKDRILDVSEKVAKLLDFKKQGVTIVKVKYLHKETKNLFKELSVNKNLLISNHFCSYKINNYVKLINLKYRSSIK